LRERPAPGMPAKPLAARPPRPPGRDARDLVVTSRDFR
jgi:hypothetical protein